MAKIASKSQLAVVLSKLRGFAKPKVRTEQYLTDSEVAADMLWDAFMAGHIDGKVVADLGSGTGILGLGALLLGAKKVFLVENDEEAMRICKQNHQGVKRLIGEGKAEFLVMDVNDFDSAVDTVIQNPPFGTRQEHADKRFLEKAFSSADVVYSFHKTNTARFVESIAKDNGFIVDKKVDYDFPLKKTYEHQERRIHRIKVSVFVLVRENKKKSL